MSTIQAPAATDTTVFIGTVSTAPTLIRKLPDHRAHLSFRLDTEDGPGVNVHVDGTLAELAKITIHRHSHLKVLPAKIYRRSPAQITLDVDAAAFDLIHD